MKNNESQFGHLDNLNPLLKRNMYPKLALYKFIISAFLYTHTPHGYYVNWGCCHWVVLYSTWACDGCCWESCSVHAGALHCSPLETLTSTLSPDQSFSYLPQTVSCEQQITYSVAKSTSQICSDLQTSLSIHKTIRQCLLGVHKLNMYLTLWEKR